MKDFPEMAENNSDFTLDGERYVRMPMKVLYLFLGGLAMATWAYFDLHSQTAAAIKLGEENEKQIVHIRLDVSEIGERQAIGQQRVADFIESSERLYNRYFREPTDPEWKKK